MNPISRRGSRRRAPTVSQSANTSYGIFGISATTKRAREVCLSIYVYGETRTVVSIPQGLLNPPRSNTRRCPIYRGNMREPAKLLCSAKYRVRLAYIRPAKPQSHPRHQLLGKKIKPTLTQTPGSLVPEAVPFLFPTR